MGVAQRIETGPKFVARRGRWTQAQFRGRLSGQRRGYKYQAVLLCHRLNFERRLLNQGQPVLVLRVGVYILSRLQLLGDLIEPVQLIVDSFVDLFEATTQVA